MAKEMWLCLAILSGILAFIYELYILRLWEVVVR